MQKSAFVYHQNERNFATLVWKSLIRVSSILWLSDYSSLGPFSSSCRLFQVLQANIPPPTTGIWALANPPFAFQNQVDEVEGALSVHVDCNRFYLLNTCRHYRYQFTEKQTRSRRC